MEDPILNRSIAETKELATRWSQFHDFFRMGVKGENLTPQAEMKFLEVKMRVAMLHGGFMANVRHDQKIAQNMISVMSSCILLKRLKGMNPSELQKLEYDWNEAYLLISETVSQLEEDREALLPVSETLHKAKVFARTSVQKTVRVVKNPFLMVPSVLLVLIVVAVGIPLSGLYDIRDLKTDVPFTRKFYNPTMNAIRVVFSEIPYADIKEVKLADPKFGRRNKGVVAGLVSGAGEDAILELTNRGFPRSKVQTFFNLFTSNRFFESSVYFDPRGEPLVQHVILFESASDAKEVVKIRRDHMASGVSQELLYSIDQNLTICRRSNLLVLLETSTKEYREEFAKKRWGFSDSEIGV